jgi:hypothetical protein
MRDSAMATARRLQWLEYLHCSGCAKLGEAMRTQLDGFGYLRGERHRVAELTNEFVFD